MTSLASKQIPSAAMAAFLFVATETKQKLAKEMNVQWVFLWCPGVGKGTYTSHLSRLLSVPYIAIGDLIGDELASFEPLVMQVIPSSISPEFRSDRSTVQADQPTT